MQQIPKHVNYVEVEVVAVVVIGLHLDITHNNPVRVRIRVLLEVRWVELRAIHPAVMVLQHHVLVLGIVRLAVPCQDQYVIHNHVMEPQLRVRIPVPQEGPCQEPHVRVPKVLPRTIHVRQVVPYQVLHVRFPQEVRHNMDVRWGEVWWEEDVNFPRDNVCDDSCVVR
jgi:hypothetical protein